MHQGHCDMDAKQVRGVCLDNTATENIEALLSMRQSILLLGGPDRLLAALTGLGCSVRDDSVCPAADGCPRAAAISVDAPVGCPSFGSAFNCHVHGMNTQARQLLYPAKAL